MTVAVSRPKKGGKVSRKLERGQPLNLALADSEARYTTNASKAAPVYATKLGEYLSWYIPKIEAVATEDMKNNPAYFDRTITAQKARIENAVKVAKATKELAPKWRRFKRLGRETMSINNTTGGFMYMSSHDGKGEIIRL